MNLLELLDDLPALQEPSKWAVLVQEVARILEEGVPGEIASLQAARDAVSSEAGYALERAIRQANALVPGIIEGVEVVHELCFVPICLRGLKSETQSVLEATTAEGLSAVERAVESALNLPFASVRLATSPVDPREVDAAQPYQSRMVAQQLATFGDSPLWAPANTVVDAEATDWWLLWPFAVQHPHPPLVTINGVSATATAHWMRAAQMLEDKVHEWLLPSEASAQVVVRQPISSAESVEQLQRYRVLAWLGTLGPNAADWAVTWHFGGSMLEMTAVAGDRQARQEFLFKAGQGAMVLDMLQKLAVRFPGTIRAVAPADVRPVPSR